MTATTETADRAQAAVLILHAVEKGLTFPHALRFYAGDIPSIYLDLDTVDDYMEWAAYLEIPNNWQRREGVPAGPLGLLYNAVALDWNGWAQVNISAHDAEAALADEPETACGKVFPYDPTLKCEKSAGHNGECRAGLLSPADQHSLVAAFKIARGEVAR